MKLQAKALRSGEVSQSVSATRAGRAERQTVHLGKAVPKKQESAQGNKLPGSLRCSRTGYSSRTLCYV
jgi:hypothetical protein